MDQGNTTYEQRSAVKNGISRLFFTAISIVIEFLFIVMVAMRLNENAEWIAMGTRLLAAFIVLGIYSQHKTASLKMPWIVLIMLLPVFGVTLYLFIGLNGSTRRMQMRYERVDMALLPLLPNGAQARRQLEKQAPSVAGITRYLYRYAGYPVYDNTKVEYFDDAAVALEAQKQALARAEHFIFMEYHAIEDAESWHGILSILEERVKAGVEVRVFYDDLGSIGFITTDFIRRMEAKGIQCRVFNPFAPWLNLFLNNRDHRKITVIDGQVGFTGGYNLANEYFHITSPFAYWKDTGVKLTGPAVRSLTVTFLEMWNAVSKAGKEDMDYTRYLPPARETFSDAGFVLPYADSPIDNEHVGEEVYLSMVESARRYAWFITPYLILTDEMIHALALAAKRGVDVRIITPGIPDKKLIYSVTRSYYNALARYGVRIYEYTPGFCHAKMSIVDDIAATCGTINLDYRSLYHHFENGCLYCCNQAVMDTKADFEAMFEQSLEVSELYRSGRSRSLRLFQLILRLFAPLL